MAIGVKKVEVWAATIEDRPGGLDAVLGALAEAGANLECVIARRSDANPGQGVAFVTPVSGRKVQSAAQTVGLQRADVATLRIEGPDRPGLGHALSSSIASAGVNIRGVSVMRMGNRFVAYFGFDNDTDASAAAKAVRSVGRASGRTGTRRASRRTGRKSR
jgi:predicted amino acid-binding ACT domain protein